MSDRAIAQQGQEKFQFYLLALVFTLLALSVETAKFSPFFSINCVEIAGWAFLLISGITGLWYMEMNPVLRLKMAQKSEFEEFIFKMQELQIKGETKIYVLETSSDQKILDLINNRREAIEILTPLVKKLGRYQDIRYLIFRYCFVMGVLFIASARACPVFINDI